VAAAIRSVQRQSWREWELVVVMQGEDRRLQALVAELHDADPRIRGVWIPERGVSRARNAGVGAAAFDTIAFLDDDCEAEADWLENVAQAFDDDGSVGVVTGALAAPALPRGRLAICPSSWPRDFTLRPTPEDRALPEGSRFVSANLALRRWVWDAVGPFDDELGAGTSFRGGEDLDLLLRIVGAGVPIRFLPGAVVHHTSGARYGFKAVLAISTAYASGQGAVAAKLSLAGSDGSEWRQEMWRQCLIDPLRRLRWHHIPPRLPRLAAFERSYRRCVREFAVDAAGLLVARDG
jgi:glycosyltransferase involved in cell wall biosynthesis